MKGVSSWLSVLPLSEQGFVLNKAEFRDALAMRYNNTIPDLPSTCTCGSPFDLNHALNCKRGGFIIMRHNSIRDFIANLLKVVCNDVELEPHLQPLNGEPVHGLAGDEARTDIRARGFWRHAQNAFFDVRITNPDSASQASTSIDQTLKRHESQKKNAYNERIMNVEHGTFTPLVFAVNGCAGPETSIFMRQLADKIAIKTNVQYSRVVSWIRCKLRFLILRGAFTCLLGSRSLRVAGESLVADDIALAAEEARLPLE